jgi:hypothetical protein
VRIQHNSQSKSKCLTFTKQHSNTEEETFSMLTIILEDYGLGELYINGFRKLQLFLGMIEKGINLYVPRLRKLFGQNGALVDVFVTQWIITLFTIDFSIEISF